MSNYVFFKTKEAPNLQHVIVREKWNVIERAINTKVVKANKAGYWPTQISVSLKGKSYTYPQVRDVQDTGYTCGPTSSSMCSQFLKNYYYFSLKFEHNLLLLKTASNLLLSDISAYLNKKNII